MRAGGCTVQQALTAEAASIVKQAVSLAKRRGHAQVTPLHVANTMLASSTGLLRTACLQSHPHPLQCKALELCFNVALNRLPASTSSPMLAPHSHHPSLSNALVAAFKRAQAHQRRGSIENQQQPLLAVKIEIEQLIISILDDPSVSRVMREAGFSSTQVKNNVEQAVSLEITAPNPPILKSKEGVKASNSRALDQVRSEDVLTVVENLVKRRRRSSVIVGECLASCESVVRGVMERVDRGEVPEGLRNVQLVSIPPISFGHLSKGEVEEKVGEIRCLVKGSAGRGIVLYLGDLKWCAEFRANSSEQGRNYCCPVEHMMRELGKLVFGMGESGRIWLMGIATYQTYMRCRIGHPSLETIWDLHPVTIPSASLGLSLTTDSDSHSQLRNNRNADEFRWSSLQDGSEKQLICCSDCSSKFENEVRSLTNSNADNASSTVITSSLPSWLQQHKEENRRITIIQQECVQVRELRKKWNSICSSLHSHHHHHHPTGKTLNFSLISPSSSLSSYGQHSSNLHHQPWPTVIDAEHPWRDHHFFISHIADEAPDSNLRLYIPPHKDTMEIDYPQKFKELNAENLKTLCNAMEEKVSWQKDTIPEIASAILQCRSGMIRRKGKLTPNEAKEDTWLFFLGADTEAKEKIARVLACLVFGSHTNFISIGLSSFSSTGEELRNKRSRAESSCSYVERLADAIGSNPHRVFFMEDIEQIDYCSQMSVKSAIERGRLRNSNGDEVRLFDAIIVLSCESFNARSRASSRASSGVSSRASSPQIKQKSETQEEECLEFDKEISPCMSLDLNLSFEDVDDISYDDIGLLDSVDGRFVFKFSSLVE